MLVMIDNYDSFTYNLVRYFQELGQQVKVVRNDQLSVAKLDALRPSALLISPGPGTPDDAGISLKAIEYFAGRLPILGVCLGHQAIAQVYGAKVVRARQVMHGKSSVIETSQQGLFTALPQHYSVTRYHSLVVAPHTVPDGLKVDAWVADTENPLTQGDIMALRDDAKKVYGVQFHPESVLTERGHKLLAAFCEQAGLPVPADFTELETSLR